MEKIYILLLSFLVCLGQSFAAKQTIIPQPKSIEVTNGTFQVPQLWSVKSSLDKKISGKLLDVLKHPYRLLDKKSKDNINLSLKKK